MTAAEAIEQHVYRPTVFQERRWAYCRKLWRLRPAWVTDIEIRRLVPEGKEEDNNGKIAVALLRPDDERVIGSLGGNKSNT